MFKESDIGLWISNHQTYSDHFQVNLALIVCGLEERESGDVVLGKRILNEKDEILLESLIRDGIDYLQHHTSKGLVWVLEEGNLTLLKRKETTSNG